MTLPMRLASLLLLLLSGCAAKSTGDSLYRDLGGRDGLYRLVDALIVEYRADQRINRFFASTDFDYFRERLFEDLCVTAGGDCVYEGLSLEDAHSGMDISEAEFNFFVEASQRAMDQVGLPLSTQNRLLARLARQREQVIRQ